MDKTPIYLTETEAKDFIEWRKNQSQGVLHQNWVDLIAFGKDLGHGHANIIFKDGLPVRVDNPMKKVILGVRLTNS